MRDAYQTWNPSESSEQLIEGISLILEDLGQQGYVLTLRQLYYQLVSRGIIPNSVREYSRIGNVVSRGRLAGLIDWDMIEDRIRIPKAKTHWDSPAQILKTAASGYYRSRWETQNSYIEVWCEKDAVSNIIYPVCEKWDVTFMANRGYSSQSAMYRAGQRFEDAHFRGKELGLIYLGDHDPSGIDMSRDIQERMDLFLGYRELIAEAYIVLEVDRIALNMDQVQKYQPPENPAKVTDSRFDNYVADYGDKSWELDALEPKVLAQLVEDKIKEFVDDIAWKAVEEKEEDHKVRLMDIAKLLED